jgi:hypothetical protein
MIQLVTSNASFIEVLYSGDPKQRKALLKTMTDNQQQALCASTMEHPPVKILH